MIVRTGGATSSRVRECETALFAAAGFLLLGLSDLAVDLVWIACSMRRLASRTGKLRLEDLSEPRPPGALAVCTPVGDGAAVIGHMLRHSLATFEHQDYASM